MICKYIKDVVDERRGSNFVTSFSARYLRSYDFPFIIKGLKSVIL